MLAMVVNDDADCLVPRGVWSTIASMLAPTVNQGLCFKGWSNQFILL